MAATAAAMGGSRSRRSRNAGDARPPVSAGPEGLHARRDRARGHRGISGTGSSGSPPNTWDLNHTQLTMDNVKNSIERLGGTMSDFLYMQVFFCLLSDDSTPLPAGSAAFAAYQQGYQDLNSVYNPYWQGTKYGAPPRSCVPLAWIPGNSLI
jgi:enamine deaminase RidA (YjgF/YER057c/UK114 family)